MEENEQSKLNNNYVGYCLKKLSQYDSRLEKYLEGLDNFEVSGTEISIMFLVTNFLTMYPLYKEKIATLSWDEYKSLVHFSFPNIIFNENGFCNVADSLIDINDYNEYDDEIDYRSIKLRPYESNGRYYEADDLAIINEEEILWNNHLVENKLIEEDLSNEDFEDYKKYNNKEFLDLITDRLKNGNKLSIPMLYEFIRNAFAHNTWKFTDNLIYIYHEDESTGKYDFNLIITPDTLYSIVLEYVNLVTRDKYHFSYFISKLMFYDDNQLYVEFYDKNIIKLAAFELKGTKYFDDFKEKTIDKLNEFRKNNLDNDDYEYDAFVYISHFMKDYFLGKDDINGFNERIASVMSSTQVMANYFITMDKKDSPMDEYEPNENNYIILLIKSLLNAIFVQNNYSDIDLSFINFESLKLDSEYISLANGTFIKECDEARENMTECVNNQFEKYYDALLRYDPSTKSGKKRINQSRENLDKKYLDIVKVLIKSYENANEKRNRKVFKLDNNETITHIRNSLAHGNIDISFNSNQDLMSTNVMIKDYSEGKLTFSASFKLCDLLNNMLKPEIKSQLDPKPLMLVR